MTDWGTKSVKPYDIHAGNDLIMGGYRSRLLMAAMKGYAPEFTKDGYVKEEVFKVFSGFFKETVEYWNSFELSKEGKDTVSVTVEAGTQLHPRVDEKVKEGVAQVFENKDGSRRVTYRRTDRGAYLKRGDVQACVCRVLERIMDSVSYREMIKA